MKKLFAVLISLLLLNGCQKFIDPCIQFYQGEKEISSDTISVDLGSTLEIRIESMAPTVMGHVDYFLVSPNDDIVNLSQRPDLLNVYFQQQSESIQDNRTGEKQCALFKKTFSESDFQTGDTYQLKVTIPDLEKHLFIRVI